MMFHQSAISFYQSRVQRFSLVHLSLNDCSQAVHSQYHNLHREILPNSSLFTITKAWANYNPIKVKHSPSFSNKLNLIYETKLCILENRWKKLWLFNYLSIHGITLLASS